MELGRKQWIAIFIAVTTIISFVGYGFYLQGNSSGTPDPGSPLPGVQPPAASTPIAYTVQNVPVTVDRLLGLVRLVAYTESPSVQALVQELQKIEGVAKVGEAGFTQPQSGIPGLPFLATVQLKEGTDAGTFLENVKTQTSLTDAQALVGVLLKLPQDVELLQPELSLSKPFKLEQPFTEALVFPPVAQGDQLQVSEIEIVLVDQAVQRITVDPLKVQSTANVIQFRQGALASRPIELLNSFVFSGTLPSYISPESLQAEFLALSDVNSARIEVTPTSSQYSLSFPLSPDANLDANAFLADVNASLSNLAGLSEKTFTLAPHLLSAQLSFASDANFFSFREAVLSVLAQASLPAPSETLPSFSLQGEISAKDPEKAASLVPGIQSLLSSRSLSFPVQRVALFDANTLTDSSTQEMFTYSGTFRSLVSPAHSLQDTLSLSLSFVTQGQNVVFVQGTEAEIQDGNAPTGA